MRIAAAQLRPAWLAPAVTTERTLTALEEAARQDVDLVAFPETWLAGYPFWLDRTDGARFDHALQKAAYGWYLDAAVEADGPEVRSVVEAARDLEVFTYLGIAERGSGDARGTVFASLLAVDPSCGVVSHHRKLVPTYEERLVWGPGDGFGLRVHQVGDLRVGGLNCWENWMQARHALYAGGEDLHVSVWPGSARLTQDITRFIAMEGRVWSLAAGGLLRLDDVPADFPFRDLLEERDETVFETGGSAVAAPDGSWLVPPVEHTEGLVVADINAAAVRRERQNFDLTGHYSRPDVFSVSVDRRRRRAAGFVDD
ncbi:MAG: carbon-nitrogen hydrolase family protein [Actinobacteria bacterium]|nr:carbon-nitrogen hydrolase family protein [Actinomycetota bacterium]